MSPDFFYHAFLFLSGFALGKVLKVTKNPTIHKLTHKCQPHSCNRHTASCACFERADGELWIKEYSNSTQLEGRTYQVNYCPWCGMEAKKTLILDFDCVRR